MTSKEFFRAIELLNKTAKAMEQATTGQIKDFYTGYALAFTTIYEMSKCVNNDDNVKEM